MAVQDNCIIKTITLSTGEVFVLPPGAEVVYVSDTNAVTSSCEEDLPTEDLLCYQLSWAITDNGNGSTQAWDPASGFVNIVGINVNGTKYDTLPGIGFQGANVKTFLESNNISLINNIVAFNNGAGFTGAYSTGIKFKSIASIASTLYVEFSTNGTTVARIFPIEVDC